MVTSFVTLEIGPGETPRLVYLIAQTSVCQGEKVVTCSYISILYSSEN